MNRGQKIILALLVLLPVVIYVIWGVLKLSYDSGPSINIGVANLDGGFSDILAWLLGVVLPVCFAISLGVVSKNWSIFKRISLPLVLCVIIIVINLAIGARILQQRSQTNNAYACIYTTLNGRQEVV